MIAHVWGAAGAGRRVRGPHQPAQRDLQRRGRGLLLPGGARVAAGRRIGRGARRRADPPARRGGGGCRARRRSPSPTGRTRTRPRSTRSPRSPSRRCPGSRWSGAGAGRSRAPRACCCSSCTSPGSRSGITCSPCWRGRRSSSSWSSTLRAEPATDPAVRRGGVGAGGRGGGSLGAAHRHRPGQHDAGRARSALLLAAAGVRAARRRRRIRRGQPR